MYTDREIAFGRFAKEDGMVVDIRKRVIGSSGCTSLFNCQFWSDFTDENERLLLGSLGYFYFRSIHNVKTLEDYEGWIATIAKFGQMIIGHPYNFGAVRDSDTKRLNMLLSSNDSVPDYIQKLWRNTTNKIQKLDINMEEMSYHIKGNYYGYLRWRDVFCHSNGSILLSLFIKICIDNLSQIVIFKTPYNPFEYKKSIHLDGAFLEELYLFIGYINSEHIKQRFKSVVIVEPNIDNLNSFIIDNRDTLVNKFGWSMDVGSYFHPARGIKSDQCLVIYPIH